MIAKVERQKIRALAKKILKTIGEIESIIDRILGRQEK
jgi:hypothetical protein